MRKHLAAFGLVIGFALGFVLSAGAARNGSGTYSLPNTGSVPNPVVTGTTISSTWANGTLADISTEITSSLDRQGRGAMLAPLQLASGTSGAPSLTFSAEPTTGLHRAGVNDVRMSVATVERTRWTATSTGFYGSAGGNGLSSQGDGTGTGVVANGGSSGGVGLIALGVGVAPGIQATGGNTSGNGVTGTGGVGSGVGGTGVRGIGGSVTDGGIGGSGGFFSGGATDSVGVVGLGAGTGSGVYASGGATGPGVTAFGGAGGPGVTAFGGSGGFAGVLAQGGTGGPGFSATGGAGALGGFFTAGAGNVDAVWATGTGTGAGIRSVAGTAATSSVRQSAAIISGGDITFSSPVAPLSTTSVTNALTAAAIPKAWALIQVGTTPTVTAGFNISSVSCNAGVVTVNIAGDMASANYAVLVRAAGYTTTCQALSRAAGSFDVSCFHDNPLSATYVQGVAMACTDTAVFIDLAVFGNQ